MAPNLMAYFLFGRLIEGKFGSRKMFYLVFASSLVSVLTVAVSEKLMSDSVALIVPKCNGTVPAAALAAATLVKAPMVYFNPLKLQKSFRNEMFMMPMFVPAMLFFMLEYYESQIGYVEYLCNS
jgi:membrane associated rhomboid family serine protease